MGRWELQSAVVMPSAELSSILHQLSPLWGLPPSTKQVIWICNKQTLRHVLQKYIRIEGGKKNADFLSRSHKDPKPENQV